MEVTRNYFTAFKTSGKTETERFQQTNKLSWTLTLETAHKFICHAHFSPFLSSFIHYRTVFQQQDKGHGAHQYSSTVGIVSLSWVQSSSDWPWWIRNLTSPFSHNIFQSIFICWTLIIVLVPSYSLVVTVLLISERHWFLNVSKNLDRLFFCYKLQ